MEFLRSTTRGAGMFIDRLSDLGSRLGQRPQADVPVLPAVIAQACRRLGVPVSLVSGLMGQSTADGFFLAARTADSSLRPKNFPFQYHHLPVPISPER